MNIDDLLERVTEAIQQAEALEDQGPCAEMRAAFLTVSFLEEELAEALAPAGVEGAIARRGAVRAALKAGVLPRARDLVEHYATEGTQPALAREIRRMVDEAEASQARPTGIRVIPAARYRVHNVAV